MLKDKLRLFEIKSGQRIEYVRAVDKITASDIFLMRFPNEAIIYCRLYSG